MRKCILLVTVVFIIINLRAQDAQSFTPSNMLGHKKFDLQLFNNLYTQTAYRNSDGKSVALGNRATYLGSLFSYMYGVSKSSRFNLGFDINFKSVHINPNSKSSPFNVFTFPNDSNSRSAISSVGPKIKFSPFKALPNFSVQTSLWIPLKQGSQDYPWLDYEQYTSWTRVFYSHMPNSKIQLFYELDILARIPKYAYQSGELSTPLTFIASYFPNSKFTLYGLLQYAPGYGKGANTIVNNYYAQAGAGTKYQITDKLQIELLFTDFFASKNNGAGTTFNLGLRYLHL